MPSVRVEGTTKPRNPVESTVCRATTRPSGESADHQTDQCALRRPREHVPEFRRLSRKTGRGHWTQRSPPGSVTLGGLLRVWHRKTGQARLLSIALKMGRVPGFCCQAPGGLRLGRDGVRQVFVVVDVYSSSPKLSKSRSPPSKTPASRLAKSGFQFRANSRGPVVEARGLAPRSNSSYSPEGDARRMPHEEGPVKSPRRGLQQ